MPSLQRERVDAGIEVLRLDRPDVRNAMNRPMLAELDEALSRLAADESLRTLIFSTTSTRALCAGADVGEQLDHEGGVARMEAFARFYAAVEAMPATTIAVCVGNCVGAGAELVTGCDLRIAGDNLKLAWPGGKLGVPVGPARLIPLLGLAAAKELIFTGRVVDQAEAVRLGLTTHTAPAEEAEATAIELARGLPDLRSMKALFRASEGTNYRVTRENAELVDWQRHGAGLPQARD